jgi:gamma-glutamylcyclotransferase (GGCT)/AIG2-like uncharacterized protein YtfP
MERPLFVYGTLRDDQMLAAVLGRPLQPGERLPAVAPGHVTVHYPGRAYPALRRQPGGEAPGDVLIRLSRFELDLLDRFEGDEYRRGVVPVMVGEELHEADAYLPAIAVRGGAAWSLAHWQARHKPLALPREAMAADEIRQRLIATRPN